MTKQVRVHDAFYDSLLKADSMIIKSKTIDCKFIITYKTRFTSKDKYLRCLCNISISSDNAKFEYSDNKYNNVTQSAIKIATTISDKVIDKYHTGYKRVSGYEIECKDDKNLYLEIKYKFSDDLYKRRLKQDE